MPLKTIYSPTPTKQVASFKTVIMEQIAAAKIKVYEFPEVEDGEEAERKENRRMKVGLETKPTTTLIL